MPVARLPLWELIFDQTSKLELLTIENERLRETVYGNLETLCTMPDPRLHEYVVPLERNLCGFYRWRYNNHRAIFALLYETMNGVSQIWENFELPATMKNPSLFVLRIGDRDKVYNIREFKDRIIRR